MPTVTVHLDLLPTSGLDLSVLVAVLVGTLVLFYLSEALGWSFGGLVVPGYVASVLVVSPAAGVTVIAEALLTLLLVRGLSDGLARTGLWSPFFGRERFLLLVLVSVLVRQSAEIWLWPLTLSWLDQRFGFALLQPGEAHSVGLVLVPLTANALGKGSLRNGLFQLGIPTLIASLLLRDVLLPGTNLSLSAMSLTYEDVSLDFLQSARAYFVLASGAWLASLFNGAFAWSAGGILIPALLGLAWYEPGRVFATLGEAVIIAGAWRVLRLLPVLRHWNLAGARQLAGLFLLSASFRIGLAWIHDLGIPVRTGELSGLGYLLSALIASKILQFGSVSTAVLPALGTSLLAFGGGSTAAWALDQALPTERIAHTEDEPPTTRLFASPEGVVAYAQVRVRLDPERSPAVHLPAARLSRWRLFWRGVDAALGDSRPLPPPPGAWLTLTPGEGSFAGRGWVIVHETTERLDETEGWGTAILRPGAAGPALVVERPWSEATRNRLPSAAVAQCAAVDCAVLFVSGMALPTGTDDALADLKVSLERPILPVTPAEINAALPDAPDHSPGVGDLVVEALAAVPGTWSASATELEFLTSMLVPALADWAGGQGDRAAIEGLAAMIGDEVRLASGCAPTEGAAAEGANGTSGGRDGACLVLVPRVAGPVMVVRPGGAPLVVVASHPGREVGTLRLALGAFDAEDARVLVLDPALDTAPVEPISDPMQALHLGWRRALAAEPDAAALWIRGLGAGAPGVPRPTEALVVGAGRPTFGAPPARLARWEVEGKFAGIWSFRWAASGIDEPGLAGNHLAGPQADLVLGGLTPAVLWFSEAARAAWRADDRPTLAEWAAAAGRTLEDRDAASLVGERSGAGRPERFARLADLAARAAHQHNLNLLRKLVEAAGPDVTVRVAWDPARLLGFIELEQREAAGTALIRAFLAPGDGRERVLPSDASMTTIRAALGWMPADLRFQPVPR